MPGLNARLFRPLLFVPLLALMLPARAQLIKQEVSGDISISLPKDFRKLTGPEVTKRSQGEHEPIGMYADAANEAEVAVNITKQELFTAKDIEMMKEFYKANIRALYTKVTFHREAIETIGGKKAVVFEFSSEAAEKNKPSIKKYTYVQYLVRSRHVVVFTFSCDEKNRTKWQPIAGKLMGTAKVK